MKKMVLEIRDRRIVNLQEFINFFVSCKDGKHLIQRSTMNKRSIRQNAYYHGVVVPMVFSGLIEAGFDGVSDCDDTHEIIKHIFLKKRFVSRSNGDEIQTAGSTTKLTTVEFNAFIDEVIRWAAEYLNISIPDPNQEYALLREYVEDFEDVSEN